MSRICILVSNIDSFFPLYGWLLQVGTPKTHRRFLAREDGTYGPMPRKIPKGLLGMPFNTTVSQL